MLSTIDNCDDLDLLLICGTKWWIPLQTLAMAWASVNITTLIPLERIHGFRVCVCVLERERNAFFAWEIYRCLSFNQTKRQTHSGICHILHALAYSFGKSPKYDSFLRHLNLALWMWQYIYIYTNRIKSMLTIFCTPIWWRKFQSLSDDYR